jgi:hypothetical protein
MGFGFILLDQFRSLPGFHAPRGHAHDACKAARTCRALGCFDLGQWDSRGHTGLVPVRGSRVALASGIFN